MPRKKDVKKLVSFDNVVLSLRRNMAFSWFNFFERNTVSYDDFKRLSALMIDQKPLDPEIHLGNRKRNFITAALLNLPFSMTLRGPFFMRIRKTGGGSNQKGKFPGLNYQALFDLIDRIDGSTRKQICLIEKMRGQANSFSYTLSRDASLSEKSLIKIKDLLVGPESLFLLSPGIKINNRNLFDENYLFHYDIAKKNIDRETLTDHLEASLKFGIDERLQNIFIIYSDEGWFIERYFHVFAGTKAVSKMAPVPESIIELNKKAINWWEISKNTRVFSAIPQRLISEFVDNIDWFSVVHNLGINLHLDQATFKRVAEIIKIKEPAFSNYTLRQLCKGSEMDKDTFIEMYGTIKLAHVDKEVNMWAREENLPDDVRLIVRLNGEEAGEDEEL